MKKTNILIVLLLASFPMFSQWMTGHYTNEFNERTGQTYEFLECYGTFDNSATNGSDLTAVIYKLSSVVSIKLFEYNKHNADFKAYGYVNVKVKNESGIIETFKFKESNGQLLYKSKRHPFLDFIKDPGVYKFYMKNNNYSISTYNFSVEIL